MTDAHDGASNDQPTITPVILSGGAGTRLWPMSRAERPKQLLALTAELTMLQLTAARTGDAERFSAPIVIANAAHADQVEAQLTAVGAPPAALILEPMGRNTAPAIALAARRANDDSLLLVMPSDHVIADIAAFHEAIARGAMLARDGWLVTFGIHPTGPETGYGWIEQGECVGEGVYRVGRFIEKPPLEAAEAMLAAGGHYWNGGIFLFRADAYLAALGEFAPEMLAAVEKSLAYAQVQGNRMTPDPATFADCPANSIDYAVMEKAIRVAVVPVDMGWSDVGSWDALHALATPDADGNVVSGDVIAIGTRNCLARSDGPRIAMLGVEDLIVVASGNDILILPRGRSQEVRTLTDAIKK